MNVTEFFRRLSYGEFSNLSIGSSGAGEIEASSKNKLISYLNEALLRLHSRFILKENGVVLLMYDHITHYKLDIEHAMTNSDPGPGITRYIMDSASTPFMGDVIKITEVYNGIGERLPLNDLQDSLSYFTPEPRTIQVPLPVAGTLFSASYQANHPLIEYDDFDREIDIPLSLEGGLAAYVAHKLFFHMNGQENSSKSSEYLALYENICQEIVVGDLVNASSASTGSKLTIRGFV